MYSTKHIYYKDGNTRVLSWIINRQFSLIYSNSINEVNKDNIRYSNFG